MQHEQIKDYHAMWVEAWRLIKGWLETNDGSDAFFERAEKEAKAFVANHKDHEWIAMQIVMDVMTELGRISTTIERNDA